MSSQVTIASPRYSSDEWGKLVVDQLTNAAKRLGLQDWLIYYDFPVFRDTDDVLYTPRIMFASRSHGLTFIDIVSHATQSDTETVLAHAADSLAQLHSLVYGRLLKSRVLRLSPTELGIKIHLALFAPEASSAFPPVPDATGVQRVHSISALGRVIEDAVLENPLSADQLDELRSVLEGAKALLRPKERAVPSEDSESKAALLRDLESEIVTFDIEQRRAAISTVPGPQRIRGLAGSGKTVVLAMKAAHLHLTQPEARILVTFHTKSLYGFIKRLITRFYRQFSDTDPDFEETIHVRHSWGGTSMVGVYSDACEHAGVKPMTLSDARINVRDPFGHACGELLSSRRITAKYHYVLVDEAQDLPNEFLQLCHELCIGPAIDRNLIWAYDELQTIMRPSMPSPSVIFGNLPDGTVKVDLARAGQASGVPDAHDIVLHKCYRNPREILVCAHALGLGIYSDTIVQILENRAHWEDVGYHLAEGECVAGSRVRINRPSVNSPLTISEHQPPTQIIQTYNAESPSDELNWVASQVTDFLREGLRPDDLLVVSLNDRTARAQFRRLSSLLAEHEVACNDVLAGYGSSTFSVPNELTLSTVYKAKGNEAPVVFVIGVDGCYSTRRTRKGRNRLFAAFTRAKGWLRVSGVGEEAEPFLAEIDTAMKYLPELVFTYPDPSKVEQLQRDLADRTQQMAAAREDIGALLRGGLTADDLKRLLEEMSEGQ